MADKRNTYEVTINGIAHTMLLDAEDAERYGKAAKKVAAPKVEEPEGTEGKTDEGKTASNKR